MKIKLIVILPFKQSKSLFLFVTKLNSNFIAESRNDKNILNLEYENKATQTDSSLSSNTPRKIKLRKQLDALRKKITRIEKKRVLSKHTLGLTNKSIDDIKLTKNQLHSLVDKIIPKEACEFVKAQIDNAEKKLQGKRYTKEFKEMCLNLYYSGPKAYKQIRKSFNLLSVRFLQKLTKKVCFRSGVNDVVFQILKIKAELLKDYDKYCTLCIDEMSLKAYLNYAYLNTRKQMK